MLNAQELKTLNITGVMLKQSEALFDGLAEKLSGHSGCQWGYVGCRLGIVQNSFLVAAALLSDLCVDVEMALDAEACRSEDESGDEK
ncbi:hypothetical protein M2323_002604 [Rhodoblastus acidophilus]|uniref:hypothetical protein n=1 Tax=Rhodoblastus acidophilus TaxID=1074 RepID=UPI002225981F|nr:hypothetical protein [Rhodoblastus acidophilus]MCW2284717.1 hypothetical protein [Rhodoblastus acidophilus]MCW2333670.1 hypothetical protein [Rhodoblastus acidophilus]